MVHNLGLNLRLREAKLSPLPADLQHQFVDPRVNPEQLLLDHEKLRRLQWAIDALSEQQQLCLRLRMKGLRYREIADIVRIRTSTVSEFLKRALSRLRKAFDA